MASQHLQDREYYAKSSDSLPKISLNCGDITKIESECLNWPMQAVDNISKSLSIQERLELSEEEGDGTPSSARSVHRYTSLKDIISGESGMQHVKSYEEELIDLLRLDGSNIAIKNQLVKHAASVYVQSTVILANRGQSWVETLWERVKERTGECWRWYLYVWYPLRACVSPLYAYLQYLVDAAFSSLIRI